MHPSINAQERGLMAKIGYARVSTHEQHLHLQLDELQGAGVTVIYQDTASGKNTDRPELMNCLKALREGDTLTVWRLDRLGRNLPDLIRLVSELEAKGVTFTSLKESIDTRGPSGKLVFHIFAALAQFERELLRERTLAGLSAARTRGRKGGRPSSLTTSQKKAAASMMSNRDMSISEICAQFKISRSTLYNIAAQQSTAVQAGN